MTLNDVFVSLGKAKEGGGLYVQRGGKLTLDRAMVVENVAARGGGMDVAPRSTIVVLNSLFDTNRAESSLTTMWGGHGG